MTNSNSTGDPRPIPEVIPYLNSSDGPVAGRVRHPVRRLLRNPVGVGSLVVLAGLVAVAALAPVIAPFDPNQADVLYTNSPPFSGDHILGADAAGRDVLSRLIWATRGTLLAVIVVLAVSVLLGVVVGLVAGFYRGPIEIAGNWASDAILALPGVVLLIALYAVIGPNILVAMAVYGVLIAPIFYRMVRHVVVNVRSELYIDAAKVAGLSDLRIIFRHVIIAVRSPVIIQCAGLAGAAVAIQASLEFLGLGSPREPSWGGMLELAFRNLYVSPEGVAWPAIFVTATVLAFVLLGNALRDVLGVASRRAVLRRSRRRALRAAAIDVPPAGDASKAPRAALVIRGLRIGYPVNHDEVREVVRGVDLTVNPGEILGLVGESGSGKSQTAFAVLGLLPKNAVFLGGSVNYRGVELLGREDRLRSVRGSKIAYIPQEPMSNLDPTMTIGAQLIHGLRATSALSRKEARGLLLDLLARVGIADPVDVFRKYPHEISGGMAQRVLITGAIAAEPELIIADEPTTALDVTVQADVLQLIRELQRERNLAVLLVTHNLGVVADICDRVAVMQSGVIVETSNVAEFFAHPKHDYSQALLAAARDIA